MDIMGLRSIYATTVDNQLSSICTCKQLKFAYGNQRPSNCLCGESDCTTLEWLWDTTIAHSKTEIIDGKIIFHPVYSQGTSVVRGNMPLRKQYIHYWEIKIGTLLSGTDLMLGIGTDKANLLSHLYKFASVLGLDDQSWGYSYRGLIQNMGKLKYYGNKYFYGCIVGIYLDLFKGHLEFYINRRPQGIAYRNIPIEPDTLIYPMACSTMARSSVKLINASSFRECLQFRCMKIICKYPNMVKQLQQIPGLKRLCSDLWFLQCKERYQYCEFQKNNLLLEDEAIICGLKHKKLRTEVDDENSSDSISSSGIYDGMHNIAHSTSTDSSDEDVELHFLL